MPAHFYTYSFASGPLTLSLAPLTHPAAFAREFFTFGRFTYLLEAFAPLAFLPLFSRWSLLALPGLAIVLLANDQLVYHLSCPTQNELGCRRLDRHRPHGLSPIFYGRTRRGSTRISLVTPWGRRSESACTRQARADGAARLDPTSSIGILSRSSPLSQRICGLRSNPGAAAVYDAFFESSALEGRASRAAKHTAQR